MADATSKPPNSLGLKLETSEPGSVDIALFDIFLTYLPGESEVSATAAAARIHHILLNDKNSHKDERYDGATEDVKTRELEESNIEGFLHAFWDMYFLLGCQIDPKSEAMDRHVNLVGALKQLPGEVRSERNGSFWQKLPRMAWFVTERWNQINLRDDNEYRLDAGQEWYNLNALLARLTAAGLLGGLLCALQSIVQSLECLDKRDPKFLFQYKVPAAALWLMDRTLAAKLLEACCQGECSDSNSKGYLWTRQQRSEDDPGMGYSLQRWNFWHYRLGELIKHRDADERSGEICRKALETMDAVVNERRGSK